MTYGEVKEKIRDYGFEEDSTMQEYQTIVKNAVNAAQQLLYDDIVLSLKDYYRRRNGIPDISWEPERPEYITNTTEDDFKINLPDNVLELVPLLASYFIWLDDDNVKSTYYWNTYDENRQRIINSCLKDAKAKITGGLGW